MLAVLLAAHPAPELVEAADRANEAYIGCLFAQSRDAHAMRLPLFDFKLRLTKACVAEERQAQKLATHVLAERGEANARETAKRLTSDARDGVVRTYASLPRIERKLEELREICRQRPDACD